MRDAFVSELTRLAEKDPRVFLITGDLGFGVLEKFEKRFPRQFLNAGVAEQNMTGLATGMALEGRVVFTYSIANFPLLRCLEQVRNDACYHNASVKIVSVGAGFSYGSLGASHHATEDISIARALPNLIVISPGDDWEAVEATSAIAGLPGPALLRLDRTPIASTRMHNELFQLGKARTLREGTDLTLVTTGAMLMEGLAASEQLMQLGIRCRVLHYHTIKPLDVPPLVAAAVDTGGIMTLEEHSVFGGFGGAVSEAILEAGVAPRCFYRMGLREGFSSRVGSQQYLRSCYGLDVQSICVKVQELLAMRPAPRSSRALNI